MTKRAMILVPLWYLLFAAPASAHPLGNFTINHFSRVEVAGHRIYVRYVVDMAEIPTLQRVPVRVQGLELRVAGRPAPLRVVSTALAHPRGQAGLRTTRFQALLAGPTVHGRVRVAYVDRSYAGRLGWKEIVVGATSRSASDELRAYPKDLLRSPFDVRQVATTLAPTDDAVPTLLSGRALAAPDRVADSGFASLIDRDNAGWLVILASLAVAFFWGLVHALSPGHGKAIITAYLVGARGTPRQAAYLGLIVTATHTAGVFALGFVTLLLSHLIVPDRLYPYLNLVSGLTVVLVALSVFVARLRTRGRAYNHGHHHHEHGHSHGHEHGPHGHSHAPTEPGWRGLVAVGVSGGLIPCPSALVVLLAAISLHRVAFGLLLIVAFSAGLAITITGIGLIAVLAKQVFRRVSFEGRLVRLLPTASALVILMVGIGMTLRAIPTL